MTTQAVSASVRDLSAYHDRTIALLLRYFRMSLEIGRMLGAMIKNPRSFLTSDL